MREAVQGLARAPDPGRPLPGGRLRGGRGRGGRRRAGGHRRHPAAHRGGGRCTAATRRWCCPPTRSAPAHLETIRRYTRRARPGPGGARPHERPVRDQGRRGLRSGGEPARLAHHALREQGHGRAPGQGGGADHGGARPGRAGPDRGPDRRPRIFVKEAVFPFLKFPGADILLGPGDEVHGRGDGDLARTSGSPSPSRRWPPASRSRPQGTVFISVNDFDKGGRAAPCARARTDGLPDPGHPRHRRVPDRAGRGRGDGLQGERGPAQRGGPHQETAASPSCSTRRWASESFYDDGAIRKSATLHGVLCVTTLTAHRGHRAGDPGAARDGPGHA